MMKPYNKTKAYEKSWARFNSTIDTAFIRHASLMYHYYNSADQWDAYTKACLEDQHRPFLTFNEIRRRVDTGVSEQISSIVDMVCLPNSSDINNENAGTMSKVLKFLSYVEALKHKGTEVYRDGWITGRGYFYLGLGYAKSSKNLYGQPTIKTLNPKNVILPREIKTYDPKDWPDVHIMHYISISEIEEMYGEEPAKKARREAAEYANKNTNGFTVPTPNTASAIAMAQMAAAGVEPFWSKSGTMYTLERNDIESGVYDDQVFLVCVERQFKLKVLTEVFFYTESGEYREIPDKYSNKDTLARFLEANPSVITIKRPIERIRTHVMTVGGIMLHDEYSPFTFFTVVPFFANFVDGKTTSMVEFMVQPQNAYNKALSAQMEIVLKAANPTVVLNTRYIEGGADRLDEVEKAIRGTSQEVIKIDSEENPNAIQNTILRLSPEQVPQTVDIFALRAQQALNSSSGANESQMGQTRPDASAKFTALNAEYGSRGNLHILQNLEYTYTILARCLIEMVQRFMGVERTLHILRGHGFEGTETLHVNTVNAANEFENDLTIGEYGVTVTIQPDQGTVEAKQYENLLAVDQIMARSGGALPTEILIAAMPMLKNKQEIMEKIQEASQPTEEQAAAQEAQSQIMELELQDKQLDIELKQAQIQTEQAKVRRSDEEIRIQDRKVDAEERRTDAEVEVKKQDAKTKRVKAIFDAKRAKDGSQ